MENLDFTKLKMRFINANLDEKIEIYVTSEGLSQSQYKELLRAYPLNQLDQLEKALA